MPAKRPVAEIAGADVDEHHDQPQQTSAPKRTKLQDSRRLIPPSPPPRHDVVATLSDELLVRILSHLGEKTLLGVSLVSHRFNRIASDSQLWRPHYYQRFVLPRAHRIPGFKTASASARTSSKLHYSAQKSIWADGGWGRRGGLVDSPGAAAETSLVDAVDWKKQYKLRHNWARGRCAVDEVHVHNLERPVVAEWQTVVKVIDGLAVTADADAGLRAWDLRTRNPIAQAGLRRETGQGESMNRPTCLAVDGQRLVDEQLDILVGFQDGSFGIWRLDVKGERLMPLYSGEKCALGELEAVAYGHPYVLTATRRGFISLYTFESQNAEVERRTAVSETTSLPPSPESDRTMTDNVTLPHPYLLTSLKSHSTRPPLALSIRRATGSTIASIAYTFDAVGGWSIGIQDLDIRPSGVFKPDAITSRVAYTLPTQTRGSASSSPEASPQRGQSPTYLSRPDHDGPIRLRYSHPYLLATLPDNTLVLHLCTSTASSLTVSPGIRLWGHTSGISDAEITPRGKAVSVSTRGDEIRVWELEGRVGGSSVEVKPRQQFADDADAAHLGQGRGYAALTTAPQNVGACDEHGQRNQVGFDDEMVIVLKGAQDGRESLVVYDFT